MKEAGIKTVYYSDENGNIVKYKIDELENSYETWFQKESNL